MIEIDTRSIQDAIKKIQENYSQMSEAHLHKAISNALNRSAQQARTAAGREIRNVYNISATQVNKELKVRYSQPRTLTARVVASGSPLSLTNFSPKQELATETVKFDRQGRVTRTTRKTRKAPKSGVSFEVKKGNRETLPTAFIQTANGGTTIFARGVYKGEGDGFEFGKARLPIAKMTTTSIPLMFANDDVMIPAGRHAEDFFIKRVDHEINFIMSKIK